MSVIPKFPSSDQGQITDKFKEHELRLSIMESKLKEFDTRFLQNDNNIEDLHQNIRQQDERQFACEKRINAVDDRVQNNTESIMQMNKVDKKEKKPKGGYARRQSEDRAGEDSEGANYGQGSTKKKKRRGGINASQSPGQ